MRRFRTLLKASDPPRDLSLFNGLKMLEAMGQSLGEASRKQLRDVQRSRNDSYLEHGYVRLRGEDAERLNSYAAALCGELLGDSLDALRASVRHSW